MCAARTTTKPYTPAGLAAAFGTMFAWAFGVVLVKLTAAPFVVVSFYRLAFACQALFIAWRLSRSRRLPWRAGAAGGAIFAVHQIMHFGGLRYTTVAVVTILFALQPLIVAAAGGWVTGERATVGFYLWTVVAVGGCAALVVASSGSPATSTLGTVLAAGNLLSFSAYYLATKRARERTGTAAYLLVMASVAWVCIGVLAVVTGAPLGAPAGGESLILAAIAIVPGTIGHLLITWAHPRIHAAASSAVILGVPIVASVAAAVVADEPFGPVQAIGGLVALAGAAAAMRHPPPIVPAEAAERIGEAAT